MSSLLSRSGAVLLIFSLAFIPTCEAADILAYYQNNERASTAVKTRFEFFNQLAMDTYDVDAKGMVTGTTLSAELALARSKQMLTFATVSNFAKGDFDPGIAHAVITTPAATETFLTTTLEILKTGKYSGLNVDFEAIPAKDRAAFSAFIKTVGAKMRAAGYLTVISVPAKTEDEPGNSWSGAFDFKALGSEVDLFQLMTYDQYGSWGEPGPVAGLEWVEKSVQLAVSLVPAKKISMGIAAFGYDWDLADKKKNKQVAWTEIPGLLKMAGSPHWDAVHSSPFFRYTKDDHPHVVWYEDNNSLGMKTKLVEKYHLAGVSVYALGMEDEAFWKAIHSNGL